MDTKLARFALAALAATVLLTIINAFLYPVVFPKGPPGIYRFPRSEPSTPVHFVAVLVTSVLLAYVYPKGYGGRTPWAEGLRFGMLTGLLVSLPTNLHVYAATETPLPGLVTAVLWTVITWGITGSLIGAIYGRTAET
jgi:hypothetical protein